jgi:hypothetical protein
MTLDNIKRKHIIWMFDWCYNNLGQSKFNHKFKVVISRKKEDVFGQYVIGKDIIRINIKNHKSLLDICDTVIHEYTHYLQNMEMYTTYVYKYNRNYSNHPYEVSAVKKALKYKKKLRADFKKEFGFPKSCPYI